jgi:8-oxo-dGTP pyrophosphatase MutT (NUDIX family)
VISPRARDAATIILLKGSEDGKPKILMGRRNTRDAWADLYIFPGGRVDPTDHRTPTASELNAATSSRLQLGCSPARSRALGVAAIRELYEETGLMLGRTTAAPVEVAGTDTLSWESDLLATGLAPDLAALHVLCRAITPPQRPKRFNARFFIADATLARGSLGGTGELTGLRWFTLKAARKLDLPLITRAVLEQLDKLFASSYRLRTRASTPLFRTLHGRRLMVEERS